MLTLFNGVSEIKKGIYERWIPMKEPTGCLLLSFPPPALSGSGDMGMISARHVGTPVVRRNKDRTFLFKIVHSPAKNQGKCCFLSIYL